MAFIRFDATVIGNGGGWYSGGNERKSRREEWRLTEEIERYHFKKWNGGKIYLFLKIVRYNS